MLYEKNYKIYAMPMGGPLIMPRSRVTPRRCANLYLRYLLHNLIQLALTLLFTFKTKRMTVSCFVFGFQYVCHLTGESETRCKTFWCLWKTCGRAGATSGLAFDYSLKGHFSYILTPVMLRLRPGSRSCRSAACIS